MRQLAILAMIWYLTFAGISVASTIVLPQFVNMGNDLLVDRFGPQTTSLNLELIRRVIFGWSMAADIFVGATGLYLLRKVRKADGK